MMIITLCLSVIVSLEVISILLFTGTDVSSLHQFIIPLIHLIWCYAGSYTILHPILTADRDDRSW